MSESPIAIGLDLGTSGARAVAMNLAGDVVAEGRAKFPPHATVVAGPRVEQSPETWTLAAQAALRELTAALPTKREIIGVAVDATSGTFLLVDQRHEPLTAGVMYSDLHAADLVDEVAAAIGDDLAPYGIQIAAAFALPKLVCVARSHPRLPTGSWRLVHQTDWIVGMLCGRYDVTDVSTALKTGVDPGTLTWPAAIERLGIRRDSLPVVVAPGTIVGRVTASAAERTGLPPGAAVVAGCTDGTAGCLASGASCPGDLNVTLGTTLVFKAISPRPIMDPQGAVYNHRHPQGGYLPGAASSTGGDWIEHHFPGADLTALNVAAARHPPTDQIVYPLVKHGERFPFACPHAQGFGFAADKDPAREFAAGLEGVAFLERLAIDRLRALGLDIGPTVYATGGGSASDLWLRVRAAVNQRVYSVPSHAECAVGAAVLAAMPLLGGCAEAVRHIVRSGRTVEPESAWIAPYQERYPRFLAALRERGYL